MNKKHDILQTAERLFYTNGFHATSTDHICSEAGVSTRTLYRYFPSREILTGCVMAARQNRFFADLLPCPHPQAISTLFQVLENWMHEQGALGCFFVKAWGEYALQDVRLAAQALDYRYAVRRYIIDCLRHRPGPPPPALANAVWMLFEGAITSALIVGPEAARDAGATAIRLIGQDGEAA